MKKITALLLCLLMTLSFASVAFAAADTIEGTIVGDTVLTNDSQVLSGTTLTIEAGATLTVARSTELAVTGSLIIKDGGALDVNGSLTVTGAITVEAGGTLDNKNGVTVVAGSGSIINDGFFVNAKNVTVSGRAIFKHKVTFGAYNDANSFDGLLEVRYASTDNIDADEQNFTLAAEDGTTSTYVYNGYYLLVQAHLDDSRLNNDKYGANGFDDSREEIYFNGSKITNYTGLSHEVIGGVDSSYEGKYAYSLPITTAGDVDYEPISLTDESFKSRLTRYTVMLPSKDDSYKVVRTDGQSGNLEVKAGDSLSFKVEVYEGYKQSDIKVYAYDTLKWTDFTTDEIISLAGDIDSGVYEFDPSQKQFYLDTSTGIYKISDVQSNYKVIVVGIVSDKMIDIFSSVMDLVQRLIETFKDVFEQLSALFQSLGINFKKDA